ncbi:E3 ubiquitin ligase PQT3-like [Populus alba x Populus x berolinensis]|uniref:E3 ubiquitin ligase PQT3-like n=1 Tax=Populus alba x Populus x berolinensis TaxID=444605 RepID=A0AAD6LYR6_9ROSI|nr:E3 ubiquitin ligase PQT3-like [Populus alba x Populus x berolinensis]
MGVIDEEENRKILELVNTPALDWLWQGCYFGGSYVKGGKYGRTRGGLPNKTPPEGYLCHRCHVGGHFIQHCPTNGDPNYDVKRVKAATGIPKSMLKADPEGRYVLRNGEVAVMKPNEDIFEKEMEGIPARRSSWSVNDVPPDLLCPLCKKTMKDAVLTSKCCFKSFCDRCIRDHLINSRLKCECGATDMLTDYLIPNMTVRRAINRILECDTSSSSGSGDGSGSRSTYFQVQDLVSFVHWPSQTSKVSSTTLSATSSCSSSKEQQKPTDRKLVSSENRKKRKRNASDQNFKACENYMMMPTGSGAYNPNWTGMWGGMEGSYPEPYYNDPMGSYGYSHLGMPYGNTMPQDFWYTMNSEQAGEEA